MRIRIPTDAAEALTELAIRERRDARDQAVVLLIEALRQKGVLADASETTA